MPNEPIEITWLNLDRLWREWNLYSSWARAAVRRTMGRVVEQVYTIAAEYPPAPHNSTYRRTKALKKSISGKTTMIPGGVQGVVGSNSPYAKYVNAGHGVIVPKRRTCLSWTTTKAVGRGKKRMAAGARIFAMRVGPWEGWHNFDKAIEQGRAIFLHELKSLEIAVARRFNGG